MGSQMTVLEGIESKELRGICGDDICRYGDGINAGRGVQEDKRISEGGLDMIAETKAQFGVLKGTPRQLRGMRTCISWYSSFKESRIAMERVAPMSTEKMLLGCSVGECEES